MKRIITVLCSLAVVVFSFGGTATSPKTELLTRMDAAVFKNPSKPPKGLTVSWVNADGFIIFKQAGDRQRMNIGDRGIIISADGSFSVNGKIVPRNDDFDLFRIIYSQLWRSELFGGDDWTVDETGVIRRGARDGNPGIAVYVDPESSLIRKIVISATEPSGKVSDMTLELSGFKWYDGTINLPSQFKIGDLALNMTAFATVTDRFPEYCFRHDASPPENRLTAAGLEELRQKNLPGASLPDGTLTLDIIQGKEQRHVTLDYRKNNPTFGKKEIDGAFGLLPVDRLVANAKCDQKMVLINDVWCVKVPGGNRHDAYFYPETGALARLENGMQKINIYYAERDGKILPVASVFGDELMCYPAVWGWQPRTK